MSNKYTIKDFNEQYPDEDTCLNKVFKVLYGDMECCPKCKTKSRFTKVKNRKCFQCSKCRKQIYPCKGTIFEKSDTSLHTWFFAIFLFSCSKNGMSAKELQRLTGVTYKTAWRMLKEIRSCLTDDGEGLSGLVELDETYVGGKNKNRHKVKRIKNTQGRSYKDKYPVFGMLERGSKVKAWSVPDVTSQTLNPFIHHYIDKGSIVCTDEWTSYYGLDKHYKHEVVFHGKGNYVNGDYHTNGMENFWSIVKRTINGSYISVSRKYLQYYINECVFKYNHRESDQMFRVMLNTICSSL